MFMGNFFNIARGAVTDVTLKDNYYHIFPFDVEQFQRRIANFYNTTKVGKLFTSVGMLSFVGRPTLVIHRFFIPELIFLMQSLNYRMSDIEFIVDNTWIKARKQAEVVPDTDTNYLHKILNVQLKPYQDFFVKNYIKFKTPNNLNGFLLSFEQGLGKTLTSLSVMEMLGVDKVIVIAPKSTLHTVWVQHLQRFFKQVPKFWTPDMSIEKMNDAKYIIVNYEALEKVIDNFKNLTYTNIGAIVDEVHNFLDVKSNRTTNLINFRTMTQSKNFILMSGTPIKALGSEMIPILRVLDPLFDEQAITHFKEAFGVNTEVAVDIIRERLSGMMHRKLKTEVEHLPPKIEKTIKIKIPNGSYYGIINVKKLMSQFLAERAEYHRKLMPTYTQHYNEVMLYLKSVPTIGKTKEFQDYYESTQYMHKYGVDMRDKEIAQMVQRANTYEDDVIIPILPKSLKAKFEMSITAFKYLKLKLLGEVLGRLLPKLRSEMTASMLGHSDLINTIRNAKKKTVIFTSYVDVVEKCHEYVTNHKFSPITVYGKTSSTIPQLLDKFKHNPKVNPLIATVQTLSTGVTLVEANTVVFLNSPWRHVEYSQAADRIYRIGQDTEVYIFTYVLDTGDEPNLSTRMEEIVNWSKEQFTNIVGDNVNSKYVKNLSSYQPVFDKLFNFNLSDTLTIIKNFISGH